MPTWNPDPIFERLTVQQQLACLLFGEVRGETLDGQIAVANVVRNRAFVTSKQRTPELSLYTRVILKPWAFSCFDGDGGNWNAKKTVTFAEGLQTQLNPTQATRQLLWIALGVLDDALPDVARGATHYFVRGTKVPIWANGRASVISIDSHDFYKLGDHSYI